ncbi:hypothetical protein HK104_009455 [Borealophlyctis nickersoniae]|nr:hypothetical protein HK104_009455 [Borealophlyctis nickersoniae]
MPVPVTSTVAVAEWRVGVFDALYELLHEALRDDSPGVVNRLYTQLLGHRTDVLNLLDEPPQDPEKRKALEKGTVTIRGRQQQQTVDFCRETFALSQFLKLEESRAATLLNYAHSQLARFDNKPRFTVAVIIYHAERKRLLACLLLMLERFVPGSAPDASCRVVCDWLNEVLSTPLPKRVIECIQNISGQINLEPGAASGSLTREQLEQVVENANEADKVISEHLNSLVAERRDLGMSLFLIAYRYGLAGDESLELLRKLQNTDTFDDQTLYLLCSFLATFDPHKDFKEEQRLKMNGDLFKSFQEEVHSPRWKLVRSLRGIVWLQWLRFIRVPSFDAAVRAFAEREVKGGNRSWMEFVGSFADVYGLVADQLLGFRGDETKASMGGLGQPNVEGVTATSVDIDEDMQDYVISLVEGLVDELVIHFRRDLRTLKQSNEDAARSEMTAQPPLTAWESLLRVLKLLYADRPDAGLDFWTTKEKHSFLAMCADVHTPRFLQAFLEMLASLATGPQSARYAHEQLYADHRDAPLGNVSWHGFFRNIDRHAEVLAQGGGELSPEEQRLIISFLRLLQQVAKYSFSARRVLVDDRYMRALYTLFQMLVSRVSVELKAALLNCIASFCLPTGDAHDIQQQVWAMLEQSQIVPTVIRGSDPAKRKFPGGRESGGRDSDGRESRGRGAGVLGTQPIEGILYDLEETESMNQTYPETLAFLKLLNVLLHPPKTAQMAIVLESLGGRDRTPGVRPYLKFVVERVFLKINSRHFQFEAERWRMYELCLKLFEKCLRIFDMSTLGLGDSTQHAMVRAGNFSEQVVKNACLLGLEPGFELLCRILSGGKLKDELFKIINVGFESVDANAKELPSLSKSVLTVLRLVKRILEQQQPFLEVLAPAVLESGFGASLGLPVSMTSLDQLLAYHKETVVNIADYINCCAPAVSDEICWLSTKILTILSQSAIFTTLDTGTREYGHVNRLVSLLDASAESRRIQYGFINRLEADESEEAAEMLAQGTGGDDLGDTFIGQDEADVLELLGEFGALTGEKTTKAGMVHSIRIAILDLLLDNLRAHRAPPTIAHFLLGYDVTRPMWKTEISDPSGPNSQVACLHAILELLQRGTKAARDEEIGGEGSDEATFDPLWVTHPSLSERCYELVYLLCADINTSAPTMRYLRTRDFFYRQLKSMPATGEEDIVIDSEVRRNAVILARLHQRAWLMKTIALELHMTTLSKQRSHTAKLVDLLFVTPLQPTTATDEWGNMETEGEDYGRGRSGKVQFEQPLTKMLEMLNSMSFAEIFESKIDLSRTVFHNQQLSLDTFLRTNERGVQTYDLRGVCGQLLAILKSKEASGSVSMSGSHGSAKEQMKHILQGILEQNFNQELFVSRLHCVEAWSQICQITLAECFSLLPADSREPLLFGLLEALLPKISAPTTSMLIAETVSQVVLLLLVKLSQDRLYQAMLHSASTRGDSSSLTHRLPVDSLQQVGLKGILDGILKPGASIVMRGNYYAALLSYLQYTKEDPMEQSLKPKTDTSLRGFGRRDVVGRGASEDSENVFNAYRVTLVAGNHAIINAYSDRLLDLVCQDASDADDVWRVVAFALLDALYDLAAWTNAAKGAKSNNVLEHLVRRNFLGQFIRNVKDKDDKALRNLLDKGGEHLMTAKYIHELKMSLFLRLSLHGDGATTLLDHNIVETLTDCHFLEFRPEGTPKNADPLSPVPTQHECYHDILVPSLELILSILGQVEKSNNAVLRVSRFISRHRDLFVTILRDRLSEITLASLEELQLVTALFAYVAGNRGLFEDGKNTRSSYHTLLLALLNKYSVVENWLPKLRAVNDLEVSKTHAMTVCEFPGRIEALSFSSETYATSALVLGRPTSVSVFQSEVDKLVQHICRNLLSYCQSLSDMRDRGGLRSAPVFTPSFAVNVDGDQGVRQNLDSSRPTLGTIVAFSANITNSLFQSIEDHKSLRIKIGELQRLPIDEVNEIAKGVNDLNEDLSASHRRDWAGIELHKALKEKAKEVLSLLYIIEHTLVLTWRHIQYFLSTGTDARRKYSHLEFELEPINADNFRANATAKILPFVSRLAALELTSDVVGNAQARTAFIQMLARGLQGAIQGTQA